MISRSLVCSQGSVDSVLANHFLPRPGLSAPLSKQKTGPRVWAVQCDGSREQKKEIYLLQKISSLEIYNIYFLATEIENLNLNQIDRDLL